MINKIIKKLFGIITIFFSFRFAQNQLIKTRRIIGYVLGFGYGGEVEYSGELKVLKKIIKSSDNEFCIFDVGCNKGDYIKYVYYYGKKYSKRIRCHAFEPNSYCYEYLNSEYGNFDDLVLNNLAVSNENTKQKLYYDHEFSGSSSLIKPDDIESYDEMDIKTTSLDEYTSESIDLLKVDVEGYEMNVFKSAYKLISERKIKNILFEFGGQGVNSKTFFIDIYKYFTENDYTLYRITPTGYLFEIIEWEFTLEYFSATNYLAKLNS